MHINLWFKLQPAQLSELQLEKINQNLLTIQASSALWYKWFFLNIHFTESQIHEWAKDKLCCRTCSPKAQSIVSHSHYGLLNPHPPEDGVCQHIGAVKVSAMSVCVYGCVCVMSSGWWVGPLITSHAWDRTPWGPNTTTLHPQCVLSIHTNNEIALLRRKQLIHTSTLLHVRKLLESWRNLRQGYWMYLMCVSYLFIQDSGYLPAEL